MSDHLIIDRHVTERAVNLAGYDINVLVAFDALMNERSVTRAGRRIGLSQSAMSHTLARLRSIFEDQLFVRDGSNMVPTDRAVDLATSIEPALNLLRNALQPRSTFDPGSSFRHFIISMNDAVAQGLLPLSLARIRREAPGVQLTIKALSDREMVEALRVEAIDLAVDIYDDLPDCVQREQIIKVDLMGVARCDHPLVRTAPMSLSAFMEAPHIQLAQSRLPTSVIDHALGTLGIQRNVVLRTPFLSQIPELVAGSDLVSIITRQSVANMQDQSRFVLFELPVELPRMSCDAIWHRRSRRDAGVDWLRSVLVETGRAVNGMLP